MERRQFLGALADAIDGRWIHMTSFPKQNTGQGSEMPHRTLGKTGESVSCIGLGGFHLGLSRLEEADAIRLFQAAIDRGINFSDNSWGYDQGESERRVGKGLKGTTIWLTHARLRSPRVPTESSRFRMRGTVALRLLKPHPRARDRIEPVSKEYEPLNAQEYSNLLSQIRPQTDMSSVQEEQGLRHPSAVLQKGGNTLLSAANRVLGQKRQEKEHG